jgi:hypothetical protein
MWRCKCRIKNFAVLNLIFPSIPGFQRQPFVEIAAKPRVIYLFIVLIHCKQLGSGDGLYFVTFTCYQWKQLIVQTHTYDRCTGLILS